jgi:hypothetical protein
LAEKFYKQNEPKADAQPTADAASNPFDGAFNDNPFAKGFAAGN